MTTKAESRKDLSDLLRSFNAAWKRHGKNLTTDEISALDNKLNDAFNLFADIIESKY